jgi:enoyl-CoA hydratase
MVDATEAAEATDAGSPTLHINNHGVATLQLQRPQHLNRLHRADLHVLQQHLQALRSNKAARVLVLASTGRVFSSGFHLTELAQTGDATTTATTPATASADPHLFAHTVDALHTLPLATVARLHGPVYGGATDLALACDFRVGVHGMVLHMPAAKLGLHYYASGLQRYVHTLGLNATKRLFLLAPTVGAQELLALGYLTHLVAAAELDDTVAELTSTLCAHAPLAVQGMKLSINELASGTLHTAALQSRELQCAASADLQEGLAAALAKRAPQFIGR